MAARLRMREVAANLVEETNEIQRGWSYRWICPKDLCGPVLKLLEKTRVPKGFKDHLLGRMGGEMRPHLLIQERFDRGDSKVERCCQVVKLADLVRRLASGGDFSVQR